MFLRLLYESFARQRRRKLLAGLAILLGTTAVTAMLALALSIGDRIHQELAVYGANLIVYPKADTLSINLAGQDLKPATGGAYLQESSLEKLKTIFWANNITGLSPELATNLVAAKNSGSQPYRSVSVTGVWFDKYFSATAPHTGIRQLNPSWQIAGAWPGPQATKSNGLVFGDALVGQKLATELNLKPGDQVDLTSQALLDFNRRTAKDPIPEILTLPSLLQITGIVTTGGPFDTQLIVPLEIAQRWSQQEGAISRIEVSARTKPEDAFARQNPDTLSPAQHEIWYCRPYANSIAYQIREAIPGAAAEQVRRVEQSEGTVLSRISGLMWLISAAALIAAGFAVSASMATAVLERRREIGLMRSLGASRTAIAGLFYAETGLLAVAAGTLGYLAGSALAYTLGAHIFPGEPGHLFLPVLLPITLALALTVAIAGSTPSIRRALALNPSTILRDDA